MAEHATSDSDSDETGIPPTSMLNHNKKMFNGCLVKTIEHLYVVKTRAHFTTKLDTTNGYFNTFLPSFGSDASPSLHDQNLPHHQNFFGKNLHLLFPGLKKQPQFDIT